MQQYCEEQFGLEWVRRWGATARQVCSATHQLLDGSTHKPAAATNWLRNSTVTCRSIVDPRMPAASAPHVLCDATNLRLDPAKLRRARCPRHRPGYFCISPTYHHYQPGAWSVNCTWPGFNLAAFSKDHQQDIFGSMWFQPAASEGGGGSSGAGGIGAELAADVEVLPTLLVTREIREHANVFHTFTDLLNVYISIVLLGWEHTPRQVVILDAHPPGSLDILWPVAAAGGGTAALPAVRQAMEGGRHPWDVRLQDASSSSSGAQSSSSSSSAGRLLVRRVQDFKVPVMFRHAAFVPPGYTSLLFAHLYEESSCPLPTTLFAGFRRFLLSSFGLDGAAAAAANNNMGRGAAAGGSGSGNDDGGSSGGALVIRLVSRRPTASKPKMDRQIANEAEVEAMLSTLGNGSGGGSGGSGGGGSGDGSSGGGSRQVSVSLLDFADLSVEQQLALVQQTDVLIGMHGAALAYALMLPPHAALVELWPQADGIWRCYQNMAQWAGALYRRVASIDPSKHRQTPSGDTTEVDVGQLRRVVAELLPLVQQRRLDWRQQQQEQPAPNA